MRFLFVARYVARYVARLAALLAVIGPAYAELALAPFPFATLVAQGEEAAGPQEFVLSAVEKIRRETSIETLVTLTAERRWITYEVPADTDRTTLKAHYAQQLGSQILFRCDGRDCGRSNTWANQIFGQAILYGRDQAQTYLAAQLGEELIAVYLIKRGNRRQYAHVEILRPQEMPQLPLAALGASQWQDWLAEFARKGFAEVPRVQPQPDGELSTAALAVLASLAASLPPTLDSDLQLVCHLYPSRQARGSDVLRDTDQLVAASLRCAQDAAEIFAEASVTVVPQGVGPLAPNQTRVRPRLVLVAPDRLTP